ncbi:MAG: FAD-binding protein [Allosphingosinicella sp.]|uniref:FAD-binding protein n=1 Tax=Allosphingosinicella sp. TaxID=2823234 RepID=UPI00395F3C84
MTPFQTCRDTLVSFDGGERSSVEVARPDKLRFWSERDWRAMPAAISRGAGLSYAAASFGAGAVSIEHAYYNRILAFDERTGELTVEAGADLWTCQHFLLSRGFYLPCHPGHGRITIGGCVAADVHGKNPWRDGTFSAQVRGLTLLHPDHGLLTLSRDSNADLLALTCGAYGLTGHVLTVTLAARALESPGLRLTRRAFDSLAEAFDDLRRAVRTADFAYSWHDLSSKRGTHFIFSAAADPDAPPYAPGQGSEPPPLPAASRRRSPVGFYNRASLPLLNAAYKWKTRRFREARPIGMIDALFPIHGSEIYFSLYGRKGFHEYQALVPPDRAVAFVERVRRGAAKRGVAIALCSAKAFGGEGRFLRFAGEGIAIAFNFPRGRGGAALMADIDAVVMELGGKPNIAKDSRLPADVARACYPGHEAFRAELLRFDPRRRIRSSLSERLQL